MGFVLTLFDAYQKGAMPYPGPPADQPAKVMEIFNILTALKTEYEARLQKEQMKAYGRQ